jgi:RNA polymerase sigma-70 factor (ECF subfamily)
MRRGPIRLDVILPTVAPVMLRLAGPYCVWFQALNISQRNCTWSRSCTAVSLTFQHQERSVTNGWKIPRHSAPAHDILAIGAFEAATMEPSKIGPSSVTDTGAGSGASSGLGGTRQKSSAQAGWQGLVGRCAAADQSALAALYDESNRLVYTMALGILRDPADAEEVTLDVYMQVWKTAAGYSEDRGSVGAWLVMLARTRAIDRLRSRQSRTRLEDPLKEPARIPAATPSPEQEAQGRCHRERVVSALKALTPEQRQAVELALFSGFTHSELAVHLNQPLGTVKTRVRQGMMKLRATLGEFA